MFERLKFAYPHFDFIKKLIPESKKSVDFLDRNRGSCCTTFNFKQSGDYNYQILKYQPEFMYKESSLSSASIDQLLQKDLWASLVRPE